MKISELRLDQRLQALLPEPNARAQAQLRESIREKGILIPLLVTRDGLLLDGHRRFMAAKDIGLAEVPVQVVNLDAPDGWERLVALEINLLRRHLNEAQRVALGTSLERLERPLALERQRLHGGTAPGKARITPENGSPECSDEDGRVTARVAAKIDVSRKTFERGRKVMQTSPELAARMLKGAISIARACRQVRIEELKERAALDQSLASPGLVGDLGTARGRYRTIYCDPPWSYDNAGVNGAAAGQYPTMSMEELKDLPVGNLAHSDGCHLWLWTTWPMLRDGKVHQLIEAWGFRWVSEIVWIKDGLGVGFWMRPSTEPLVLAVKGNLPLLRNDQRGHLEEPRGRHSEKPAVFAELIEGLSPDLRIELFARKARAGWDRWGLEAGASPAETAAAAPPGYAA